MVTAGSEEYTFVYTSSILYVMTHKDIVKP